MGELTFTVDIDAIIKVVTLASGLAALAFWLFRARFIRKKMLDFEERDAQDFVQQFNKNELKRAVSGYIVPHCSPSDPCNKEGEEFLADTRENIFEYVDRTIESLDRGYHLVLADTGMGKTLFCINYFSHVKRKYPNLKISLISLSSSDATSLIKSVPKKRDCVLILDALDEDPKGFGRGKDRLSEILEHSADFKNVIVTCRSQYFMSDDHIPHETPLPMLINRKIGQGQNYNLVRSYLSPFDEGEIRKYIATQFPIYKFWRIGARFRARQLATSIPDLAYRPMLLERLPELALTGKNEHELYDLYRLLVDGWLRRESRWIETDKLNKVSTEIAIAIFEGISETKGRVDEAFIQRVAETKIGSSPDWKHLTSRSLLNRDSKGKFKFAHKSVLEYLVVNAAIEGDQRPLQLAWTPFMKELFVSWGHAETGSSSAGRARDILKSDGARENINPLFDSWLSAPVNGLPNFKRCAARKETAYGTRLMPPSWRGSTIEIKNENDGHSLKIFDFEFNLEWVFYQEGGMPPLNLAEALKLNTVSSNLSLPSYEQLVTLIEGLHHVGNMFLPSNRMFAIGDKPGKNQSLMVDLNNVAKEIARTKIVDRERKIFGTGHSLNTYLTQPDFQAHKIRVPQLWIVDSYKLI